LSRLLLQWPLFAICLWSDWLLQQLSQLHDLLEIIANLLQQKVKFWLQHNKSFRNDKAFFGFQFLSLSNENNTIYVSFLSFWH
jgi:hypothetical protein